METKDFKVIDEIFKIICEESKLLNNGSPQKETPKAIIQDQSVSEIEETPGRKSPILALSSKVRNNTIWGLNLNKKKSQKSRYDFYYFMFCTAILSLLINSCMREHY